MTPDRKTRLATPSDTAKSGAVTVPEPNRTRRNPSEISVIGFRARRRWNSSGAWEPMKRNQHEKNSEVQKECDSVRDSDGDRDNKPWEIDFSEEVRVGEESLRDG